MNAEELHEEAIDFPWRMSRWSRRWYSALDLVIWERRKHDDREIERDQQGLGRGRPSRPERAPEDYLRQQQEEQT